MLLVMRKIVTVLCFFAFSFCIYSCVIEQTQVEVYEKTFDCFEVTIHPIEDENGTKASLGGLNKVRWTIGDEIGIFSDQQGVVKYVLSEENGKFYGEPVTGTCFYAFYPYSDNAYDENDPMKLKMNLSANSIPMVAKSSTNSLLFKQTVGILHFRIKWDKKLFGALLKSNQNNEALFGDGYVDLSEDAPKFVLNKGNQVISAQPVWLDSSPDETDGRIVYECSFLLPEMEMEQGFNVSFSAVGDDNKTSQIWKITKKECAIARGKIKSYKLLDIDQAEDARETAIKTERATLIEFYNALGGDNWVKNTNWCSDKPVSEWYGVTTYYDGGFDIDMVGRVEWLNLSSNNLCGTIPESIGDLACLERLILNDNAITGTLPEQMTSMKELRDLYVGSNQLEGPLPDWLGHMQNLKRLALYNNLFSGEVPNSILELDLHEIQLQYNLLTGPLPVFSKMELFDLLGLSYNYFTGSIPAEYAKLLDSPDFDIQHIWIDNNYLSGEIPASISNHPLYPEIVDELFVNQRKGYGFDLGNTKLPACRHIFDTLDGGVLDLGEQYGCADYTMIVRWGEWCTPSKAVLPVIISLAEKFENKGLQTIFAYAGGKEDARNQVMHEMGLDLFPYHIIECHQEDSFIRSGDSSDHAIWFPGHDTYWTPFVEIVDRDGNIVFIEDPEQTYTNYYFSYKLTDLEAFLYKTFNCQEELYASVDYSSDGEIHTLQVSSIGNGINVVLMGDAFSDRLIADGTYESVMRKAMDALFSEEPFTSFKDCFNVYYVDVVSKNEVYFGETTLDTWYSTDSEVGGDNAKVLDYARKVLTFDQIDDAVVIVIMNRDYYAGTCYMTVLEDGDYGRGASISYFPSNSNLSMFNGMLHHEACGHGFAKLADEYAYEHMGSVPKTIKDYYGNSFPYGWWRNCDFTGDPTQVKWSQFISDPRYEAENIGTYEGAFTYWTGAWRPTEDSIMNQNVGGFNAPSRYAIWYRINKLAYGPEWQGTYEDFVEFDKPNRTAEAISKRKATRRNFVEKDFVPLAPPVIIEGDWRNLAKH